VVDFLALPEQIITDKLISSLQVEANLAKKIAHQCEGNYNKALHLLRQDGDDSVFEEWFINWVRAAFKAKGNASVITDLISWSSTISKEGRETQKNFLQFCIQFFRQALLLNYQATDLVYLAPNFENFKLEKFAPFVHGNNIMPIFKELEDAIYHIERNGNSNIILTDLSIKLTRLLHQKEV
jgi:DNA polymerase-3 subunit delta'